MPVKTLLDYAKKIGTLLYACPNWAEVLLPSGKRVLLVGPSAAADWREQNERTIAALA